MMNYVAGTLCVFRNLTYGGSSIHLGAFLLIKKPKKPQISQPLYLSDFQVIPVHAKSHSFLLERDCN